MPEKYKDWWYEDLPEECKKAAAAMGYTSKESWDDDHSVPFDSKKFSELTLSEKRAAWFLGWDVIKDKLDIWWEDTDPETQAAALVIGWTKETWDDDWHIRDFPIEHKYWSELTDEQKAAATHFGYTRITWDMTDEVRFEDDGSAPAPKLSKPSAPAAAPAAKDDEKKEDTAAPAKASAAPKQNFICSKYYGGEGGGPFDDRAHKSIRKISIFGGMLVDAIQLTYENGPGDKHGGDGGSEHSLELDTNEYVTSVIVRHSNLVQSLTFITNRGNKVEAGGKGRPLLDKKGEETEVKAPNGMRLRGITGRSGKFLDSIAFRWGP